MTPSLVPNALQASVCDEQLMSIVGEIAVSRNIFNRISVNKPTKSRARKKIAEISLKHDP